MQPISTTEKSLEIIKIFRKKLESMSIAENIAQVRVNMAEACRQAGRAPEEVTLVGASKMNDAAACREAIAAGIDALGENRVQEMTAKLAENAYEGAPLHFIGHLQRNKVRQVAPSSCWTRSKRWPPPGIWCRTFCWR